tara:strand:+ start:2422 stop:3171 length:750 start_codon:yes stop_codon:yes gene_type:complete
MNQPIRTDYIDDEIDLVPYIKHVIAHWRLLLVGILVGLLAAAFLTIIEPKQYQATTTFIMPQGSTGGSAGGNMMLLQSLGINASGGGGQSGMYSQYIMPILESHRMKVMIAKQLMIHPVFSNDSNFQAISDDQKIDFVMGKLKLHQLNLDISLVPARLSYVNTNPDLILPVINVALESIITMNDELNIDSDLLQIIPLDHATHPTSHFSPKYDKIAVITVAFILLGLILIIIGQKIWSDYTESNNRLKI